jgi:predicted small lipoprotein YifL
MHRRIRARRAVAALALLAAFAGCAKKGPPSGGPPDLEPPRMTGAAPDSGAAGVALLPRISVSFSEGMEPRSTGEAVELAPPVPIRQRRWSGHTLTLVLEDTLQRDHTYTMFVGSGARDLHGNNLQEARTIVFTTAAAFPAGGLEGEIDATGFKAPGTTLWCYREGRLPDSTARDFDALGVADAAGKFRVSGLAVPGRWHVWGFADLNHNRSFEPGTDLLVDADTLLELTAERPVARDIRLRMLNPHAPGRFAGTVIDSLGDTAGQLRIYAISESDTTRRLVFEVPDNGQFDLSLDAGNFRVRAFRDLDRNRAWKRDTEPASDEYVLDVRPGGETTEFVLVLRRPAPVEASP